MARLTKNQRTTLREVLKGMETAQATVHRVDLKQSINRLALFIAYSGQFDGINTSPIETQSTT